MAASKSEIRAWLNSAKKHKFITHVIIVCDTFDHTDYPVHVTSTADIREVESEYRAKEMQRVMEVYSMAQDIETQLAQDRAFNY